MAKYCLSLFSRISEILLIALIVVSIFSLLYLGGLFLLCSISMVGSCGHINEKFEEPKATYHCHVLVMDLSVGLGPSNLTRISLHFEVFVTLGSTETKDLKVSDRMSGKQTLASFLTNMTPWPGYTGHPQNQQFSIRMACDG